MVRLKALQAGGAADGQAEFKFHMVRLKDGVRPGRGLPVQFKFHMVRLKALDSLADDRHPAYLNSTWYD